MREARHQEVLTDAALKDGLETIWFAIGTEGFLLETSRRTVAVLRQCHFDVTCLETEGGHTWLKWRDYLAMFALLLFQDVP